MLLLTSCASRKQILYLQDIKGGEEIALKREQLIRLKPQDKVSIVVKSKNAELADLFNLPARLHQIGMPTSLTQVQSQGMSIYTISNAGQIEYPILGSIKAIGLTREELAQSIKARLLEGNHLKECVVTVEFANLGVSIMGEVNRPGRYAIDHDRLTILDALSMAGDLTIYGHRESVLVVREVDGVRTSYRVDLRSAESLYHSPAYYIQQNDIIYVEPNKMRVGQSTVNGNNVLSTSFWISLASLGTSIALLFTR